MTTMEEAEDAVVAARILSTSPFVTRETRKQAIRDAYLKLLDVFNVIKQMSVDAPDLVRTEPFQADRRRLAELTISLLHAITDDLLEGHE